MAVLWILHGTVVFYITFYEYSADYVMMGCCSAFKAPYTVHQIKFEYDERELFNVRCEYRRNALPEMFNIISSPKKDLQDIGLSVVKEVCKWESTFVDGEKFHVCICCLLLVFEHLSCIAGL